MSFNSGATLTLVVVCTFICFSEGKQLIRLRNGSECPIPGYHRDIVDCRKFYFCPGDLTFASVSESAREEFLKELSEGLVCPGGSIFEEMTSQCTTLDMVKVIPPECKESYDKSQTEYEIKLDGNRT